MLVKTDRRGEHSGKNNDRGNGGGCRSHSPQNGRAFPAVMIALLVPLLYKTNPPAVLSPHVPLIASASLAVVVAPLVLVLAYMLRIATIFKHTVTVAPFVPPAE